jgi:hypothetical protein
VIHEPLDFRQVVWTTMEDRERHFETGGRQGAKTKQAATLAIGGRLAVVVLGLGRPIRMDVRRAVRVHVHLFGRHVDVA